MHEDQGHTGPGQAEMLQKAAASDFLGRFREIVSDPLNLLIRRDALAGVIEGEDVILHNGIRVPWQGENAYYRDFSEVLIINRGVHEPLEEFAFQQVLTQLGPRPVMLELGAYWGHYSMWCKCVRPEATVFLVEPDPQNLAIGQRNFDRNGLRGTFERTFVGTGQFAVDDFLRRERLEQLDVLHADIQGAEAEMIDGALTALSEARIGYVLISTHSQGLHEEVRARLTGFGYRIEAEADFDNQTTSHDGVLLAVAPTRDPVFAGFHPLGRQEIAKSSPAQLLDGLNLNMLAVRAADR